jgi:sulfur-oxidizing protein SoxY
MFPRLRQALQAAWLAIGLSTAGLALGAEAADTGTTDIWDKVRASLFGDRSVADAPPGVLELRVPSRAADAATVPIVIKAAEAIPSAGRIRTLHLLIDKNPSPVAAVFRFGELSARAEIETRVRIEDYTPVRVVAETESGALYVTSAFVKASGGCSAPAQKTEDTARIGRMRLVLEDEPVAGQPVPVRFSMIHPNHSGLVMDQLSRHYVPAWYVRSLRVSYGGRTVLEADIDFSISENPNFRFYFLPEGSGELRAEAVDTRDLQYETSLEVVPGKR